MDRAGMQMQMPHLREVSRPLESSPGSGLTGLWRPVVIGALALVLGIGLVAALWVFARPLTLLLAAVILAQAVAPAVDDLSAWLPRRVAIAAVYLLGILVGGGIAGLLAATLVPRVAYVVEHAPTLLERARGDAEAWLPGMGGAALSALAARVPDAASGLAGLPLVVMHGLFEGLLVAVVSAYWLGASGHLSGFALSLLPAHRQDEAAALLRDVGETMGGYVRARVLVALAVGAAVYVCLFLLGVEYALPLGLVAAAGKLVPLVGELIAGAPVVAMALLVSPLHALAALLLYAAIQHLSTFLLLPHLARTHADIPAVLAIVALLVGLSVGGLLGALVAIPLAGALRVIATRAVFPLVRRWTGASVRLERPDAPGATAA